MLLLIAPTAILGALLVSCGSSNHLVDSCIETDIRPRLKDPDSLKILNTKQHANDKGEFTWISCTATNSFNARIRTNRLCSFKDGKLTSGLNWQEDGPPSMEDADFI